MSSTLDPPTGAEFIASEPSKSARQGISKSAFTPGYFMRSFREIRILGTGGNGVVLLVEHIMDHVSLGQFACKRIPVGDDHDWLEKVLLEVKLLQKIRHPNLVPYQWVWLEDHQPSKFGPTIPCLWILQGYCNGGDLHNYVVGPGIGSDTTETLKKKLRRRSRADLEPLEDLRGPSRLTFEEIFQFFRDIATGLHHLHAKGYIHRDLKPSNCLLHRESNSVTVLISDFGEVQTVDTQRGSTGATGTISYCAPEVLRKDIAGGKFGEFTTKSDIFSLGMIVYFMCFGRLPYSNADDINEENEDLEQLKLEIMRWTGFDEQTRARPDLPEKLYRYLKRLLSVDPNERPSTDEILASIKGGAGLGDFMSSFGNENSGRVSAVDSPRHRPSTPRKQSTGPSRPGLSSLRPTSFDTMRTRNSVERSHSQSHSHSRPTSPADGPIMKHPMEIELPPSGPESPVPKSPQLLLPPPPERPETPWSLALTLNPSALTAIRGGLFLSKLLSLLLPCSPYAASPWLLYPLLGLAAIDLALPALTYRWTLLLLVIHIAIGSLAAHRGQLCIHRTFWWEDI